MASWLNRGGRAGSAFRLSSGGQPSSSEARFFAQPVVARLLLMGSLLSSGAIPARAEPTFFTARIAPIFEQHCVGCHGPEKHKAGLRVDSFENVMRGSESGEILKPGDLKASELFRRITLPASDDEVMPSDGKPLLSADEITLIRLWIESGASATRSLAEYPDAPVPKPTRQAHVPLAPDWTPRAAEIAALEKEIGVKLVPRSKIPTDGLVVRTASAPQRCDDAALSKLAPIAALIVDAELARTKITDEGLKAMATWENLRKLDLTRTSITSDGLSACAALKKLEVLNLTDTAVDDTGVARLKEMPMLQRLWLFGTKAAPVELPAKLAAH